MCTSAKTNDKNRINEELMEKKKHKKGEQTIHLNSLAARSEETSNDDSTLKKKHTHTPTETMKIKPIFFHYP